MKKNLIVAVGFICYSCSNAPKTTKEPADKTKQNHKYVNPPNPQTQINILAERLPGTWTDGDSGSATLDISKDSIYYVDKFESYKYILKHDSLKIYYPGFMYTAKVYFTKDTLVMDSKDFDEAKFCKFKN
jgi:hypothetical protein